MTITKRISLLLVVVLMIACLFGANTDVSSAASKPIIKISGATYPTSVNQGRDFTMKGMITSNKAMGTVYIGVMNKNHTWVKGVYLKESYITGKSYNIYNKANKKVNFKKLKPGAYYYACIVNISGKNYTVFKKSFKVKCLHLNQKHKIIKKTFVSNKYSNYSRKGGAQYLAKGDIYGRAKTTSIKTTYSFNITGTHKLPGSSIAASFGYSREKTTSTTKINAKCNNWNKAYYFAPYERSFWKVYKVTERSDCSYCKACFTRTYNVSVPQKNGDANRYRWGRASSSGSLVSSAAAKAGIFADYK